MTPRRRKLKSSARPPVRRSFFERLEDRRLMATTPLKFDFGVADTPSKTGFDPSYTVIYPGTLSSDPGGIGWATAVSGNNVPTTGVPPLWQDWNHSTAANTFSVPVENQQYDVAFVSGHHSSTMAGVQVAIEGSSPIAVDTTSSNQYFQSTPQRVTVADGVLDINLSDNSGAYLWYLNALTITPYSAAPVLTLANSVEYIENTTLSIAASANVTDADSPNFDGGQLTVTISQGNEAAFDQLTVRNFGTVLGEISIDGNNVRYGTSDPNSPLVIGTKSGGTNGAPLVIALNANATVAATKKLVQRIGFKSTSENPSTADRTIEFQLSDGDGGLSNEPYRIVLITRVNDAPTVFGIGDQHVNTNGSLGPLTFYVQDVDSNLSGITVTPSSSNTTLIPVSGIAFGGSGATRTVTILPAADQQGSAVITLTANDGATENNLDTMQFTVNVGPSPWHRVSLPADVNGDGFVTDADITTIQATLGSNTQVVVAGENAPGGGEPDVDGDWLVAQSDIDAVAAILARTTATQHPISELGERFAITVYDEVAAEGSPIIGVVQINPAPNVGEQVIVHVQTRPVPTSTGLPQAIGGEDYPAVSRFITFTSQHTSEALNIVMNDDTDDEHFRQYFEVYAEIIQGDTDAWALAQLSVQDNDAPPVSIVGAEWLDPDGAWIPAAQNEVLWVEDTNRLVADLGNPAFDSASVAWYRRTYGSQDSWEWIWGSPDQYMSRYAEPVGDWEYKFVAQFGDGSIAEAAPREWPRNDVASVEWKPGHPAQILEPDETGNRVFPEANAPSGDADRVLMDDVVVSITLSAVVPAGFQATRHMKVFDPDHKHNLSPYEAAHLNQEMTLDPNDMWLRPGGMLADGAEGISRPRDNRAGNEHAGYVHTIGMTPEVRTRIFNADDQTRTHTFTITGRQPGNNFLVVTAAKIPWLDDIDFRLDDPATPAREDDGVTLVYARRGAILPKYLSPTLTVWRTLHVEEDSMSAPTSWDAYAAAAGDDVYPNFPATLPLGYLAYFLAANVVYQEDLQEWDNHDSMGFIHNVDSNTLAGDPVFDVNGDADFWVANLLAGYEGLLNEDNDPVAEDGTVGEQFGRHRAIVYLETERDEYEDYDATNTPTISLETEIGITVLHEVAHMFIPGDHLDPIPNPPPETDEGPLISLALDAPTVDIFRFTVRQLGRIQNKDFPGFPGP